MRVRSASFTASEKIATPWRSCPPLSLRGHQNARTTRHAYLATRQTTYAAGSEKAYMSGSDFLGPKFESSVGKEEDDAGVLAKAVDEVELMSECGLDFTKLRDLLKDGEFRKADDESRSLLIHLAGEAAESRGWIYFTEVRSISAVDLKTIDELWKASSKGKFGYSIQKRIFAQSQKRWSKFFKAIDWTVGENNNYRKWPTDFIYSLKAEPGHLPLTNCLRGTQLFEGLMQHKAFESEETVIDEPSVSEATKWTSF